MPTIDVRILRQGDSPPWGHVEKEVPLIASQDWRLVTIENGMSSGKPSLALLLDTDQGPVIAQTSLATWITATCAIRGAFPEAFSGTPLESAE